MEIGKKIITPISWDAVFDNKAFQRDLEELSLPDYIQNCRWFAGKSSTIKHIRIQHHLKINDKTNLFYILILEVQFKEAFSQQYLLPVALISEKEESAYALLPYICRIETAEIEGVLYDALYIPLFRELLFDYLIKNKSINPGYGVIQFERADAFQVSSKSKKTSEILKAEQSNTSIVYNDHYFFKWFRRVFPESNPDLEISRFLNLNQFPYTAQYLGGISWLRPDKSPISLGLMQQKVDNEGDAWRWMLDKVNVFFENFDKDPKLRLSWASKEKLFEPIKASNLSPQVTELLTKDFIKAVITMGKRTAQMHIALAKDNGQVSFTPVPFNPDYSVWLKNKVSYLFDQRIGLLEKNITKLRGLAREYGQTFLDKRNEVLEEILGFDESKLRSMRTRVHGDFHLGQMLVHTDDFYILDFEGEPESTIRDRKVKQSPLKDVAGMLRSFHYAIYATLFNENIKWSLSQDDLFDLAERFYHLLCGLYLQGFIRTAVKGGLDIGYKPEIHYLLRYHLLEKAVYELGYELNSRPAWAIIPLRGIMRIMQF
ncbi:MAG: trehalose synthase [Saprospiraceae bacterium]|nr:trehalose synthase [Saprospiraceae bacterium]